MSAWAKALGREVRSPASWRCVPRCVSASAKVQGLAALSTSGGLGRYWAAQWHLARAVGKRFRGCRAKRLYLHYKLLYIYIDSRRIAVERAIAGLWAMRGSKRRKFGGGQVRPLTPMHLPR